MAKRGGEKVLKITLGMDKTLAEQTSKQFHQNEKQRIKELLTDEQIAAKAKNQLVEETNRKRVQEAKKAAEEEKKGWFDVSKMTSAATEGVMGYVAGLASIGTASAALQMVIGYFDTLRRQANEAAMEVTGYREKLQELAALKGSLGITGPELASQIAFRAQTGQTKDAAIQMQQAGLGIGEVGIDTATRKGKISRTDFEKLMVATGKMQVMEGGDPNAYGKLAGLIPLMSKGRIDAGQGEAKLDKLFRLQQPGGFTNFSQAIGQFGKLSGYIQTGQLSDEDAMAFLSAYSVANPEAAGTMTEQAIRAVSAGVLRSKGMKIDVSQDSMKTNEFFKSIGVTPQMKTRERLLTTSKHLAGILEKDPDANLSDYLITKGFGSQEERLALMTMGGLYKQGSWQGFEDILGSKSEPGGISKRFDYAVANDPLLQTRQAEALSDTGTVKRGLRTEAALPIQRAAFAKLKSEGKITYNNFEEWANEGWGGRFMSWGQHNAVQSETQDMLMREARRVGAEYPIPSLGYQGSEGNYWSNEKTAEVAMNIRDKGGDPMREAVGYLKTIAEEISKQRGTGVAPAMQGRPPAVQVRP